MNAQFSHIEEMPGSSVDIKLAERFLSIQKDRLAWNTCKDFYAPIINAMCKLGAEPYFDSGAIYALVTGDKDKLTQYFRVFRAAGLTFNADRPKKGDTQWHSAFRHPQQSVYIYFQSTSSVCRRVKVGTQMVEQDVFETRCGDISEDSPAAIESAAAAAAEFADDMPF